MIGLPRHLNFPELDSTNLYAHKLVERGEFKPLEHSSLWISADRQTSGRGRRGREWVSVSGNLYATFLIALPVKPVTAMQMSFITALAIYDAAQKCLPKTSSNLSLKWPNDVLLNGEKLAGILIETVQNKAPQNTTDQKTVLAVGCGVNVNSAPKETSYGATFLNDHCPEETSPLNVLASIDASINHWLDVWQYGEGFQSIINAWQDRAQSLGKQVSLINGSDVIDGVFKGLAPDGALILSLPDGKEKLFYAGDVSFRTG